jgi:nucleoside-diphosphate-sugar epimerase
MNILIAGGAGFIGSNLSKRLLEEGHKVFVVDNLLTGTIENIESLKENKNFKFLKCGIEEEAFLKFCDELGNKFDRVYDLACPTGVPNIEILGEEMLTACSVGTWNVLKVAKKADADMLFTSSSEIYGEPLVTPQDEKYTGNVETMGPRSNYEEGKRFSETLVAHFVKKYGVRARTVRLFNAYGPNMSLDDTRVIPRFNIQAISNVPLTVQGDGSQSRTLCFVSDILDGFEAVITKGKPGAVYNLGSDNLITVKEFAELVINLTESRSEISYVPRPHHDHSSRMPVLDKVRSLGWNNKVPLRTGLSVTLEDFRKRLISKETYSMKKNLRFNSQPQD